MEQGERIGREDLLAISGIGDRFVYEVDVQLRTHRNRTEIGSKQDAVNAAHFDHGLEADRTWTHRIDIDVRLEVLRRLTQVLVYLFDWWVLDSFVVQLPVPIESANDRGESAAHMDEEDFEFRVSIEDAAVDHAGRRHRCIEWAA